MIPEYVTPEGLETFIRMALAEDVGEGDHSTLASVPEAAQDRARLIIKQAGVLAGLQVAQQIFHAVEPALKVECLMADGDLAAPGHVALEVSGPARGILTAERLVLNVMQRMSGIATRTRNLVNLIQGTGTRLLDTRKTTPNMRMLEKWAVRIGGGTNHRFALYDMIMLKDNHIDYAGGVKQAVEAARHYVAQLPKPLDIEVETRTLEEVRQALEAGGVSVIMLDNMGFSTMREAVALIGNKAKTEASGGITEASIRQVAETGVNYISVGALTHSIQSLDMSLKAVK